jgi:hypothetical protein
VRGTSHVRAGTRCQDASKCEVLAGGKVLLAVASDGAGSAELGGEAAAIVCRRISEAARAHFSETSDLPSDEIIWSWIDEIRDCIALAANRRSVQVREFSATLVGTLVSHNQSLVFHIGDGAVGLRTNGIWQIPSWPEAGEYASTTYFITDENCKLRIFRAEYGANGIAVFSDGIERLALNFASRSAHAPFFTGIIQPVEQATKAGRDRDLSNKLTRYLNSEPVNERTDDDKTLILAVRK